MKIRNIVYHREKVSPNVEVEFEGKQPTQPLVEDLTQALSEAYGYQSLRHEFSPQSGGRVSRFGIDSGSPDCYIIKEDGKPFGLDSVAKVVVGTESDRAYISMFDMKRQHEFLPKYADRLSSLVEQGN